MLPTADLSPRELAALLIIKKISLGEIHFLNVLDADLLVERGLAERFGKGQFILSDQGRELLKQIGEASLSQGEG